MLYFGLVVFLACGWFLPWWSLALASFVLGLVVRASAWKIGAAAALAWASLAYILDGHSHGLISQRMSGLFGMPSHFLIFLLMAVLGAVTATLFFRAGSAFRSAVPH